MELKKEGHITLKMTPRKRDEIFLLLPVSKRAVIGMQEQRTGVSGLGLFDRLPLCLPRLEASIQVRHIRIAHLLQCGGGKGGAAS